ncbi:MAG TPA: hypothetical protein ACFYEJ_01465 [Candidatus Wujingus californicus]
MHFKKLVTFHGLLINITLGDIKSRYKQSILGVDWAIVQPLS